MTHFRVRFIKWLAVLISKLASRRISRDLLQFVGVAGVVNEPHVMPENISTAEFIREAWDDYNSPPTSTFSSRVGHCRSTVGALEEVGLVLLFSLKTKASESVEGDRFRRRQLICIVDSAPRMTSTH